MKRPELEREMEDAEKSEKYEQVEEVEGNGAVVLDEEEEEE